MESWVISRVRKEPEQFPNRELKRSSKTYELGLYKCFDFNILGDRNALVAAVDRPDRSG
jgi:hypothetical protein